MSASPQNKPCKLNSSPITHEIFPSIFQFCFHFLSTSSNFLFQLSLPDISHQASISYFASIFACRSSRNIPSKSTPSVLSLRTIPFLSLQFPGLAFKSFVLLFFHGFFLPTFPSPRGPMHRNYCSTNHWQPSWASREKVSKTSHAKFKTLALLIFPSFLHSSILKSSTLPFSCHFIVI